MQDVEKGEKPFQLNITSLNKKYHFLQLRNKGHKISTSNFLIVIGDEDSLSLPKTKNSVYLGIKVNKKIAGAVKRNKIKRWVRAILRDPIARNNLSGKPALPVSNVLLNKACVFVAKPMINNVNFHTLKHKIGNAISRSTNI